MIFDIEDLRASEKTAKIIHSKIQKGDYKEEGYNSQQVILEESVRAGLQRYRDVTRIDDLHDSLCFPKYLCINELVDYFRNALSVSILNQSYLEIPTRKDNECNISKSNILFGEIMAEPVTEQIIKNFKIEFIMKYEKPVEGRKFMKRFLHEIDFHRIRKMDSKKYVYDNSLPSEEVGKEYKDKSMKRSMTSIEDLTYWLNRGAQNICNVDNEGLKSMKFRFVYDYFDIYYFDYLSSSYHEQLKGIEQGSNLWSIFALLSYLPTFGLKIAATKYIVSNYINDESNLFVDMDQDKLDNLQQQILIFRSDRIAYLTYYIESVFRWFTIDTLKQMFSDYTNINNEIGYRKILLKTPNVILQCANARFLVGSIMPLLTRDNLKLMELRAKNRECNIIDITIEKLIASFPHIKGYRLKLEEFMEDERTLYFKIIEFGDISFVLDKHKKSIESWYSSLQCIVVQDAIAEYLLTKHTIFMNSFKSLMDNVPFIKRWIIIEESNQRCNIFNQLVFIYVYCDLKDIYRHKDLYKLKECVKKIENCLDIESFGENTDVLIKELDFMISYRLLRDVDVNRIWDVMKRYPRILMNITQIPIAELALEVFNNFYKSHYGEISSERLDLNLSEMTILSRRLSKAHLLELIVLASTIDYAKQT